MSQFGIADLIVEMQPRFPLLASRSHPYLLESPGDCNPDVVIEVSKEGLERQRRKKPELSYGEYEYLIAGSLFYRKLLSFHGMLLHASALCYQNKAYLFSAPSGTGKSTHAGLWLELFGPDAVIINDDKPAIRKKEGRFLVYGTPFSGKTDLNKNMSAPLHAICVLERGERNEIRRLSSEEAVFSLLHQTTHCIGEQRMQQLLTLLDELIRQIPIYKMKCTPSKEAAELAYQTMK